MRAQFLLAAIVSVSALSAQTKVNLSKQTHRADFRALGSTFPFETGTNLPATCAQGQVYFKTDAPSGQNAYFCVQANTWLNPGSALVVSNGGTFVGQKSSLNFAAGAGTVIQAVDAGGSIVVTPSIDLAILESRAAAQSGTVLRCAASLTVGQEYQCAMTPTLTTYTTGMVLHFLPQTANSGPVSLNVDSLGPKPLRQWDGVHEFGPGEIPNGVMMPVFYDGTSFRAFHSVPRRAAEFLAHCASSGASSEAYQCALQNPLVSYTEGHLLYFKPDVANTIDNPTLNVDGLGPIVIRQPDGVSIVEAGMLRAGSLYPVWYGQGVYRLVYPVVPEQRGETRPSCISQWQGRFWFQLGESGVKDSLSVCAKDELDTFAWRSVY